MATPAALVSTVSVPASTPPAPVAMVTLTATPACGTAFPAPSRTCSTGAGESATPLCAVVGGGTSRVSAVPLPAASAMALEVTGATPVAPAVTVKVRV